MFQGPRIWGEMFLFLAAGPSQRSPPVPPCPNRVQLLTSLVQTRESGSVLCRGRGTPSALGQSSRLLALGEGEGTPCSLPLSSGQAPALYCLKPHSPMPMGRGEAGEGQGEDPGS